MRIFDPHIHMTSRTTDDYEAMHAAGVRAVVEPSFWLGQPRTSPASFFDYFDSLLGWEPFRAAQYGIAHHCTLALNPKEAGDPRCTPVLDALPRYLVKDNVVAVGEIGYDSMTPAEDTALAAQLQMAADHGLPALVHTPHRDKLAGLRRTLDVVRESALPVERVLIDHLNETTSRRPRTAAPGSASPSIPTPRWTRSAWSPSCAPTAPSRCWSTPPPTGGRATPSRPARSPT
jgi:predicted metal-dependent TIM-barrel fold hydrolase